MQRFFSLPVTEQTSARAGPAMEVRHDGASHRIRPMLTDEQDLTVQREGLASLGVTPDRIYVEHGLTGSNRERPGLREALAACRDGDTLVVTTLDRLARLPPRKLCDQITSNCRTTVTSAPPDPVRPCPHHWG